MQTTKGVTHLFQPFGNQIRILAKKVAFHHPRDPGWETILKPHAAISNHSKNIGQSHHKS